jgi:hypothetical protein
MFAFTTWLGRWATFTVRANAVHALGDDPGRCRFAGAANTGHDERLRNPVGREGVFQCPYHRILPDHIGKGFGSVFAGEHLVLGLVGHDGL